MSAGRSFYRAASTVTLVALLAATANAQSMYVYRGDDGEWIYSDRPPVDGKASETRDLATGESRGALRVEQLVTGGSVDLIAKNRFHAPLEVTIRFTRIEGAAYPHPNDELRWVLPPRSDATIVSLPLLGVGASTDVRYDVRATLGDPAATHRPTSLYRVPFALARDFRITQAYPDANTHTSPDSYYAVDVSMPVGTDIFAARGGVVIDVVGTNFRNGQNRERDAPAANVVRILHDDGTYAVYAHLNWNSVRVRAGDRVQQGEYIADSGNTGFSSGPHLHFAVIRNAGMRPESVAIRFAGANASAVTPATGNALTAY